MFLPLFEIFKQLTLSMESPSKTQYIKKFPCPLVARIEYNPTVKLRSRDTYLTLKISCLITNSALSSPESFAPQTVEDAGCIYQLFVSCFFLAPSALLTSDSNFQASLLPLHNP